MIVSVRQAYIVHTIRAMQVRAYVFNDRLRAAGLVHVLSCLAGSTELRGAILAAGGAAILSQLASAPGDQHMRVSPC